MQRSLTVMADKHKRPCWAEKTKFPARRLCRRFSPCGTSRTRSLRTSKTSCLQTRGAPVSPQTGETQNHEAPRFFCQHHAHHDHLGQEGEGQRQHLTMDPPRFFQADTRRADSINELFLHGITRRTMCFQQGCGAVLSERSSPCALQMEGQVLSGR